MTGANYKNEDNPSPFLDDVILKNHLNLVIQSTFVIYLMHMFFIFVTRQLGWATKWNKIPFHATNFVVNTFLSIAGMYVWFYVFVIEESTDESKATGYYSVAYFGCFQMGYSLWSTPIGIMMGEKSEMLIHHISVIVTSAVTIMFTLGCRYHAVYFYGVMEISSIPLVIMNVCKDNAELKRKHAGLYSLARTIFAVAFLIFRVVLLLPIWIKYVQLLMFYSEGYEGIALYSVRALFYPSLFLMILQLYWAYLILKAIFKRGKSEEKKE